MRAVRTFYSVILYLMVPVAVLRLLWRGLRNRGYWRRWGERFGFVPVLRGAPPTAMDGGSAKNAGAAFPLIWIHAVSVGEVRAAQPLVRRLLESHPDHKLLITTMTPTGSEQVVGLFGESVAHCYVPYDLPSAVARFLERTRPCLALIMETELWPNIFHLCRARSIPVFVANVRMSERSMRRYLKFKRLTAATLQQVSMLAVQSATDAARLRALGAPDNAVRVTGSIKFEINLPASLREVAEVLRDAWGRERSIWIAASTHEGEEEQVLAAYEEIKSRVPSLLLVLVPRHPERFASVARVCRRAGRRVVLHSERAPIDTATDIVLGDSMGELQVFIMASDVAFIGGSLVATGGHNLLEAAAVGVPVVFGPYMHNFAEISQLTLEHGAGTQVRDTGELARAVIDYLERPDLRFRAGEAGKRMVAQNRGALNNTLALVNQFLVR
ncbi:MAG: 3-deoxy-D-manno-octulosonic acid transferase [Candidatus Muproteobacteria bacterium RBG_16_64_11]|uniref:3-deoxy-D-manno-octulosonic acid transferase n=1 Tax=Candidatus Muproteobacteria bacterium RBG_16_64_11 TaxID=1817758 RepID=A0A1F6TGX4_9PROT|nr:MAG: 3-deoxy-D-manno-octulosonic acid transferase [Candidatus Muproteobacteria bacterium RBG_16_64_11]